MSSGTAGAGLPKLGAIPIELDRPRTLAWSHACIFAVERHGRVNILNATAEDAERLNTPDLTLMSAMLWGALCHEDKRLTLEDCLRFLGEYDLLEIDRKLHQLWGANMPKPRAKQSGQGATPNPPSPAAPISIAGTSG